MMTTPSKSGGGGTAAAAAATAAAVTPKRSEQVESMLLKTKKTSKYSLKTLYTCRKVLLELLGDKFDVSEFEDFTYNEMDAMIKTAQCDMLLNAKKPPAPQLESNNKEK